MHTDPKTQRLYVPIASIIEGERIRSDYGDLADLADSIRTEGLIHPIVVDLSFNLVAGGRRFRATRDILKEPQIAITFIETLDTAHLRRLEAEENVRRKDMTWQERAKSIRVVHQHQALQGALKGSPWSQRMTGEMLNMSQANVSYAITISALLEKNDKEINECDGLGSAIKVLTKRLEDSVTAGLAKSTVSLPAGSTPPRVQDILADGATQDIFDGPPVSLAQRPNDVELPIGVVQVPEVVVPLSSMLIKSDSVAWMKTQPEASFDHIVSDPPYGIDMEYLNKNNLHGGLTGLEDVLKEHDVFENMDLHTAMAPELFRLLKPGGFCILWADMMQWQKQVTELLNAGFKVQRWPLIWSKTHQCMNQAAQANFTKNYEIAIVARKQGATLVSPQSSSIWQGSGLGEKDLFGHPFAKPANLWKWLYSACAIRGQRVLDPFAGSGSSTVAAISIGLSPVAIEVNETHYNRLMLNVSNTYRAMHPNVRFI